MLAKVMKKAAKKKIASKGMPKSPSGPRNLELDPDAWPKFEELVKRAGKMGHKPHKPPAGRAED